MTNQEKRDSIIKKISLLKEKTTSNGCSEAEAMTAAEMISKLLQEYDLSMNDIEVRSQEFLTEKVNLGSKNKRPIHLVISSIAYFTDTKVYFSRTLNSIIYDFFGAKKDVEFATYLVDLLSNAMDTEYSKYQKTVEYSLIGGRKARDPFFKGMGVRLSQRLKEMKDKSKQEISETGLMLYNKMAIINDIFKEKNPALRLRSEKYKYSINDPSAFNSGKQAADRVNITTGITGKRASETLRIKT